MDSLKLSSASLNAHPAGVKVCRILSAALQAVDPGTAVHKSIQRNDDQLVVGGRRYDLSHYKRILVIGAGKAGAPMTLAAAQVLGSDLTQALVIVKQGYAGEPTANSRIEILEAGHPLPDQRGIAATQRMIELLQTTQPDDLVLCLISGGGSALLVSPVEGLTLDDLQSLTSSLLASGATINEINTIRKHLSRVKGGNLARLAAPAQLITLILSDVVGDPLDVIASGPTVPDPTTLADAQDILRRYQITAPHINAIFQKQVEDFAETPKSSDAIFERVQNMIIGSNRQAAIAALNQAQEEGFNTLLLTTYLQGEARQAGRFLGSIARQVAATGEPLPRPACLVSGGETTVTLQGDGLGGRNTELALSAVDEIAGLKDTMLVTLATDGGDGPTDSAGAVVTGDTSRRALQAGLSTTNYLARNDSYHFFETLKDLLKTGPTQTNVNDLALIFAF
jgi:glycerate 2-kinase